jgi:hypothetical protein
MLQDRASPRLLNRSNYLLILSTCYGCHSTLILEQLSLSLLGYLAPPAHQLRTVAAFLLQWLRSPVGSSAASRLRHALRRWFLSWARSSLSAATCTFLTFDAPRPDSYSTLPGATSSLMLRRLFPSLLFPRSHRARLRCVRVNPSSSNGSC